MKFLPICVVLVMCYVAKGSSDSFQCYECENCEKILSDSLLKSCPAATTLPPTTTSQVTDAPSSSSSPSESTTISAAPTESTTISAAPTESTTISAAPTESTTISAAPTESTTISVAPTESTTISAAPTESTTISAAPTESTTISAAPTESTTISAAPTESTTISAAPTESTTISIAPAETPTAAPPEAPETSGKANSIGYSQRHSRSLRSVLREGSKAHCFSIDVKEGDAVKINKGCIEVPDNKDVCDALKDKYGKSTENCRVCESDRCNSSAALNFSFVIFVIAILISTFVNK